MKVNLDYEYERLQDDLEAGAICLAALEEILSAIGGGMTVKDLARSIYKYTACGPWLSVQLHDGTWRHSGDLDGIQNGDVRALLVGSIVEGSDAEVIGTPIDLLKCDTEGSAIKAFDREVQSVNEEACRLWYEANGEYEDEG